MKKWDYIIILLVVAASLAIFGFNLYGGVTQSGKEYVRVTVDGEEIAKLVFDENYYEEYTYEDGDKTNTVVSDYGSVYVSTASCHDHICEKTKAISSQGEIIVCLPHKLVVEIKSNGNYVEPVIDDIG